ncbi:hypothetical protein GCM10007049_33220 [Echinicola pacifica]|uniref:endo-1,4-beta-xylanase n=1 Tax=Echinicola pacifica TaxID=346377 RepID=A0A918UUY5_9BACT|nr:endo-1,4-beta-xylanase [Echinicola pacifica]GGZ37371.1 hypothetical protein GCM10007049_33220 [Echinicola pacifica]
MNKRYLNIGLAIAIGGCFSACVEDMASQDFQVQKPESVALQEELNSYQPLKTYLDHSSAQDFTLGAAVNLQEYASKGVMYRLINSNFDEITVGYGMKHGAVVQSDGSLKMEGINSLFEAAAEAGTSIYGHTLCWHSNQNAIYLNRLLQPLEVSSPAIANELDLASAKKGDLSGWKTTGAVSIVENAGLGDDARAFLLQASSSEEPSSLQLSSPDIAIDPSKTYELIAFIKSDGQGEGRISFEGLLGEDASERDWTGSGNSSATFQTGISWKEIRFRISGFEAETFRLNFDLGYTANTSYWIDINTMYVYDPEGEAGVQNIVSNGDFEAGEAWGGWGNNSTRGLTEDGMGYGGAGKAFFVSNPSLTSGFWGVQSLYSFAEPLENGETYTLSFWARGDAEGIIRPELQSPDYSSDGFGQVFITTSWKQYEYSITVSAADRGRFIISYGEFAGTVYIDNVVLKSASVPGGETILVPKEAEEKQAIIEGELERWIKGMVTASAGHVKTWDVVNEPMDDGNPYELKTGLGKSDLPTDNFFWQDYMGKAYAVKAFQLARQYGSPEDVHFINDYNLEYNLDKCQGLIDYVAYLEAQGAQVDGIGTQMHIGIHSNKQNIAKMFEMLAATGKLIKVSELDVRVNTANPSPEILEEQSEMYKYVVDMYHQYVPKNQQYGITIWGVTDSKEDANWLPGERQGLWTQQLNRKPAYAGFVEGLQGL